MQHEPFSSTHSQQPNSTEALFQPREAPASAQLVSTVYAPDVPKSLQQLNLSAVVIEALILKLLLSQGTLSGRNIAAQLCLHFSIVETLLSELKNRLFIGHQAAEGVGDFMYVLTLAGQERALAEKEQSGYIGSAPVVYQDYLLSVQQQSIRNEKPNLATLQEAFKGLVISDDLFDTLGPAANSGRGLFLYGEPGNGKTTIAERLAQCFKGNIYIPKTLYIDGQLVQLYDPQVHVPVDDFQDSGLLPKFDQRWIKIKRPAVMVGGELTMDALEIRYNPLLKLSEAPLQMKANGGIFLIDDFGRQRISHVELLNRWIVPLEKQVDFLTLPNGQKISVPFDELIIFSTNLEPHALVDDAFLRRVPYKIHVSDPSKAAFVEIFKILCEKFNIQFDAAMVRYLIDNHYRDKRPFRGCQPRDILQQVLNISAYRGDPPTLSEALLDKACQNYFAAVGK